MQSRYALLAFIALATAIYWRINMSNTAPYTYDGSSLRTVPVIQVHTGVDGIENNNIAGLDPVQLADHNALLARALGQAFDARTPVLLQGAVRHWHALTEWSTDKFPQLLDTCAPRAHVSLHTSVIEQDSGKGVYANVPLRVFAQWLREVERNVSNGLPDDTDNVPFYLSEFEDFDELCPAAMEHLAMLQPFMSILPWGPMLPDFVLDIFDWDWEDLNDWWLFAPIYPVLWWGPKGTRTGLHRDIEQYNLLGQVRGQKNVSFLAPSQENYLYPSTMWDRSAVVSQIDMWAPNLQRFPNFAKSQSASVLVQPGDMLIIPSGWWHAVEALSPSLSVSIRVDRTSWAEIFAEMFDILHQFGVWPLNGWSTEAPACTCHRSSVNLDTIEALREVHA